MSNLLQLIVGVSYRTLMFANGLAMRILGF